jgi:hypothetical protein
MTIRRPITKQGLNIRNRLYIRFLGPILFLNRSNNCRSTSGCTYCTHLAGAMPATSGRQMPATQSRPASSRHSWAGPKDYSGCSSWCHIWAAVAMRLPSFLWKVGDGGVFILCLHCWTGMLQLPDCRNCSQGFVRWEYEIRERSSKYTYEVWRRLRVLK